MATETPSSSSSPPPQPPPPPPPPPHHQTRCNKCNKHLSPESLSGQGQAQAQAQPSLICVDCHFHVLSLLTSQFTPLPIPIPDAVTETETDTDNSLPEHLRQQQRRDTIRFHLRQFLTRPRPQFGAGARKPPPPASKEAVEGLKTLDFSPGDNPEDCAICRDVVSVDDFVKEMPCGHSYHADCILTWLSATNSCPICRFHLPTHEDISSSTGEDLSSFPDTDVVRSSNTENLPSV